MKNNKPHWSLFFQSVDTALQQFTADPDVRRRFCKKSVYALRPMIPCMLREMGNGKFIWLNRDQLPLGLADPSIWVDYEDFHWLHVDADEPIAAYGQFALFRDLSSPWISTEYSERLSNIMKAIISPSLDLEALGELERDRFHESNVAELLLKHRQLENELVIWRK